MQFTLQVENLKSIETLPVPILTFDFDKVNIDLLFAHMPLNTVPESFDIDDDAALQGVDEKTEKSLNGPRVTNLIIELVPKTAWMSFLATLRCLRVWAKQRAIYSNKLGYLGGVNFNILLAMLCQIFPNKSGKASCSSSSSGCTPSGSGPTRFCCASRTTPATALRLPLSNIWFGALPIARGVSVMPILTPRCRR